MLAFDMYSITVYGTNMLKYNLPQTDYCTPKWRVKTILTLILALSAADSTSSIDI